MRRMGMTYCLNQRSPSLHFNFDLSIRHSTCQHDFPCYVAPPLLTSVGMAAKYSEKER